MRQSILNSDTVPLPLLNQSDAWTCHDIFQ